MNKKEIIAKGALSKAANIVDLTLDDAELAKINKHTLEDLTADDVFIFRVVMADNDIDRDFERMTVKALEEMAELFIGKPVIKDHNRKADNQIGRIYDTEIVKDNSTITSEGENYTQLIAHCYIVKTEENAGFISEIKGGIKKEVSIGASVRSMTCSICGTNNVEDYCEHWWGVEYSDKTCHFIMDEVHDAYELSFVAVPAQRKAGIIKQKGEEPSEMQKEKALANKTVNKSLEEDVLSAHIKLADAFIYLENEKEKGDKENE